MTGNGAEAEGGDGRHGPRNMGGRPEGWLARQHYDMILQANVARAHAYAEGIEVNVAAVQRSYDRNLHPHLHGRRFHNLVDRARDLWPWTDEDREADR